MLVIDVGGTAVKILATGQSESRSFLSGPTLTPGRMVSRVKKLAANWPYDVVSIGYPGAVLHGRPLAEPHNLARGWIGFDFAEAFGTPVKIVNDAAMQALGSYKGGKMLFLGLGTGLGSALIVAGIVALMELAHLPYKQGTYEDYVAGRVGLNETARRSGSAAMCERCGEASHRGSAARRYGDRGRECPQARRVAASLSAGRQRRRLPRWVPVVGGRQCGPGESAVRPRSSGAWT